MFHPSRHLFDTILVILCVVAGATSHSVPNSSRSPSNYKLQDRHRLSFINLLLDENFLELVRSNETSPKIEALNYGNRLRDLAVHQSNASAARYDNRDLCTLLSSVMNGNQIKFCHKHQDILETILPEIMEITKRECIRITKDLRWNCATINLFLDRSNALSFTKEAALIRSILNASMMYLIVKTCSKHMHHSCGCQSHQDHIEITKFFSGQGQVTSPNTILGSQPEVAYSINQVELNRHDLRRLETGSPLRITRSMIRRQGCVQNTLFADALTGVFLDAEDLRSLNKAYKVLNDNSLNSRGGLLIHKRISETDYKDLSFIKWAKSALNLHNNQIGRQIVREAKTKQCKCHGVSGMCQIQTCSDQLHDFRLIATKLREIYLNNAMQVEVKNLGSYSHPDLHLTRLSVITQHPIPTGTATHVDSIEEPYASSKMTNSNRIKPDELAYLYESPDYCDAQPISGHLGTKGRQCVSKKAYESTSNMEEFTEVASKFQFTNQSAVGTCEYLCCGRGFHSELVLDIVECNCGFKFCCKVECDHCLRQRMVHFCR